MVFSFDLRCESVIFKSYAMGKSGLLDVYTQSLRAADPRDEGYHISGKPQVPMIIITIT